MAKIVLSDLVSIQNDLSSVTAVNDNNDTLETAIENTLSRDGTSPNSMGADLDMNDNRILNLPAPTSDLEPMRLVDFTSAAVVHGSSLVTPGTTTSQAIARWGDTIGTTLSNTSAATIDNSGNLVTTGNLTGVNGVLSGTLAVTGASTLHATTIASGGLTVTGTSTHTGNISIVGTLSTSAAISVGTTLGVTGALTASAAATVGTTLGVTGASTLTGAVTTGTSLTAGGQLNLATGTTAIAPIQYTSGTSLTTAVAGASEFDGVNFYKTIDTTSGRAGTYLEQYFHLTSAGSTIANADTNFFGTTSNINIVNSGYYIIDYYMWFLNTTAGTVLWKLTNSAAPTSQNILYEMAPITGLVAPPGTATLLVGHIYNDTTAAKSVATTGTLSDATNQYVHIKVWLQNGSGTTLKMTANKSAGTITPGINSYWHCRRIAAGNVGTFAA